MISIIEAMENKELFGPFFKRRMLRGDTWKSWRSFLSALFALPLDSEALETFERHTGRTTAPEEQFNEAFCISGRRGGKSQIASLIVTYLAAFRDYTPYLSPGEVGVLMVLASDRAQAKNILNYVNGFFDSVPVLKAMVRARLKESVELTNRIRIEIHTCSFKAVRGYTVVGVIADELAFWQDDNAANPAAEVLAAVRPGMATIPGSLLLGISSPFKKAGVLFDAYRNHYGKDGSAVLVWKASSREMNPTLVLPRLWDAVRARSEYLAEFREDSSSLFDLEVIERLTVQGRRELAPVPGRTYTAFADPSGGAVDSFTLAIAHEEKERGKAVLDCIREVVPPFSPEQVVKEFCALLRTYGVSQVYGDAYAKDWVAEPFIKQGINYRPAEMNRSEIYLAFLAAVMSGQVELIENKKLLNQLTSLVRMPRMGGRDAVDHPSGEHDDVANAVAGVLVRLAGGHGGVVLTYVNAVLDAVKKFGSEWREHLGARDEPEAKPAPKEEPGDPFAPTNGRGQARDLAGVPCPRCGGKVTLNRGPLLHCASCLTDWPNPKLEGAAPYREGFFLGTARPEKCPVPGCKGEGPLIVQRGKNWRCNVCGAEGGQQITTAVGGRAALEVDDRAINRNLVRNPFHW